MSGEGEDFWGLIEWEERWRAVVREQEKGIKEVKKWERGLPGFYILGA